ncbi:aldehyde oxidase GLOX1 [Ananas comosus]|uniref:Aldehyde oxidase GLOX1 n=2 Tax=Ananas comosus TaxID=4615 RepID=A0A6P5GD28_ANACO|nr:aldehyde oxidase GLOX1 [Ananas comosus]CAD1823634.1 unnamed protein product [Ananas comosus var. bracteatus]
MAPTTPGLRVAAFCSALLLSATLAEPFLFDDLFYSPQPVDGDAPPLDPVAADDNGLTPPPVKPSNVPPPKAVILPLDEGAGFAGKWEIVSENAGVSAMHLVIMKHGKAIMFDTTALGPSLMRLPEGNCREIPNGKDGALDCWAHAVEFDYNTGESRRLKVLTDPWCSSGAVAADGTLVQTGGYADGDKAVRYLSPCPTCNWVEYRFTLAEARWYGTQQILPDGSFVVLGGRRSFSLELVPEAGKQNTKATNFQFLRDTTDNMENNLYPFVHLAPDGNLFVFANDRAVILDPRTWAVVRKLPTLPGGARNYPASGMSALLPLDLRKAGKKPVQARVLVCGGAQKDAFALGDKHIYPPALKSCGRISITDPKAQWAIEQMPVGRTMGDMLLLPTADVLIINGASKGCAGWWFGHDPVLSPLLYSPKKPRASRFRALAATNIPRMYHSSSAVLPDATVLVGGSNANDRYNFTAEFPTEVRVERFYPPYLDEQLTANRPEINEESVSGGMQYGETFTFNFRLPEQLTEQQDVMVTMYAPPFTTHGFSMNQRLLILEIQNFVIGLDECQISVTAPPTAELAPPGYYLVFVVVSGVPSKAIWVQIQ